MLHSLQWCYQNRSGNTDKIIPVPYIDCIVSITVSGLYEPLYWMHRRGFALQLRYIMGGRIRRFCGLVFLPLPCSSISLYVIFGLTCSKEKIHWRQFAEIVYIIYIPVIIKTRNITCHQLLIWILFDHVPYEYVEIWSEHYIYKCNFVTRHATVFCVLLGSGALFCMHPKVWHRCWVTYLWVFSTFSIYVVGCRRGRCLTPITVVSISWRSHFWRRVLLAKLVMFWF